jgi:hypothetical protein
MTMEAVANHGNLICAFEWVVDLDLEKFFDGVHHQRLMARLETKVSDRRLLALVHRMLNAKVVMPDGVVVSTYPSARYVFASAMAVTAASRSEAMARCMEGRLPVRAEHAVHSLLDPPVHDIGNAKAPFAAACLRNPHPANPPRDRRRPCVDAAAPASPVR